MKTSKYKTPLTYEERWLIYQYIQKGMPFKQIANKLGRGPNTIVNEVGLNGGKIGYNPDNAHQRAIKMKIETNKKRSILLKKPDSNKSLSERIQNLEFQMEILIDMIKELKKQNDE